MWAPGRLASHQVAKDFLALSPRHERPQRGGLHQGDDAAGEHLEDGAASDGEGRGKEYDEALSEYRVRLISGLKRYFHTKHEEGLLSGQGIRCAMHFSGQVSMFWRRVRCSRI